MRSDVFTGSSRHTRRMSAGRVVHVPTVAGGREASYVCRTRSTASSIDSLLQPMTARGRGSGDLCKFPDVVQDSHLCQWLVPALVPGGQCRVQWLWQCQGLVISVQLQSLYGLSRPPSLSPPARLFTPQLPVVTVLIRCVSHVLSHLVYVGVMGSLFWYVWRLGSLYRDKHDCDKYVCKYAPPFSFRFSLLISI